MKDCSKELKIGNYLNFHTRIEKVESIIDLDWIRLSKSDLLPVNALGLNVIPLYTILH